MEAELRVLIADDFPVSRMGLRLSLEANPGIKVVAEAADGKTAFEMIQTFRPDIAVLDINMPVMDGFAVAREIRKQDMRVEVIFLTAHREGSLMEAAVSIGVKGYLLKDSSAQDIMAGVRAVAEGKHYISPALTSFLIDRNRPKPAAAKDGPRELTATELRILKLIGDYKTTKEIAEALFVSPLTVETHRRNICEKLGLRGSHALIKYALANKSTPD